jgi:hypothetical protein
MGGSARSDNHPQCLIASLPSSRCCCCCSSFLLVVVAVVAVVTRRSLVVCFGDFGSSFGVGVELHAGRRHIMYNGLAGV